MILPEEQMKGRRAAVTSLSMKTPALLFGAMNFTCQTLNYNLQEIREIVCPERWVRVFLLVTCYGMILFRNDYHAFNLTA